MKFKELYAGDLFEAVENGHRYCKVTPCSGDPYNAVGLQRGDYYCIPDDAECEPLEPITSGFFHREENGQLPATEVAGLQKP